MKLTISDISLLAADLNCPVCLISTIFHKDEADLHRDPKKSLYTLIWHLMAMWSSCACTHNHKQRMDAVCDWPDMLRVQLIVQHNHCDT